uniref:Uncharacterized protein n=1 Tax=Amphimedon queenslandica TaxID=400682 RepID=A0A1X7U4Z9_AMPQE
MSKSGEKEEQDDLKSKMKQLQTELKQARDMVKEDESQEDERELQESGSDNRRSLMHGRGEEGVALIGMAKSAVRYRLNEEVGKNRWLKKEVERLNGEVATLVAQLESERKSEEDKINDLTTQLVNVQSELDQTKVELQLAKESLESNNSDMEKYFQEMSKEVSLLTKDIGNKREEIRYQQTLIDQLAKERDDAYDTARNDLDSEKKKLATIVDTLRNNHERQVDGFKQTITDQKETIAVLEDKLFKVQSDVVDEIEKKKVINDLTREMERNCGREG